MHYYMYIIYYLTERLDLTSGVTSQVGGLVGYGTYLGRLGRFFFFFFLFFFFPSTGMYLSLRSYLPQHRILCIP